jgi:L-threonylcarbamoyladenylate synthase
MALHRPTDARTREAAIEAAVTALAAGRLVGLPTETVYGLGADATDGRAVAAIYAAKGRPRFNPLIAHLPDLAAAERHGILPAAARRLAERIWPGPLTLVVPKRPESAVCDLTTAGLDTIGLRVPANEVTRAILDRLGRPVAAPSANRSGRISPTRAADVVAELGEAVAEVIDTGATPVGVESTIVGFLGGRPRLLRPGGVTRAEIEAVIGDRLADPDERTREDDAAGRPVAAPGMLTSHYAPNARVRLAVDRIEPGEALLTFAGARPAGSDRAGRIFDLSPTGDLAEAAANLFRALRELDAAGFASIAVAAIPTDGLGEAIADRLGRAAAPRS